MWNAIYYGSNSGISDYLLRAFYVRPSSDWLLFVTVYMNFLSCDSSLVFYGIFKISKFGKQDSKFGVFSSVVTPVRVVKSAGSSAGRDSTLLAGRKKMRELQN
jgi:hypothetical protein